MTILSDAVRRIGEAGPGGVLFWTGAGISAAAPTSLPTGWELTDRIFGQCFEPDALSRILAHQALQGRTRADLCDRWRRLSTRPPRLETVLSVAMRHFGAAASGLLDDMRSATPNWYHRFFAAHLAAGGRHVTANLDTAIEAALHTTADDRIHHFHRTLGDPDDLATTLAAIEQGFDPPTAGRLRADVDAAEVIVVAGYSGSDACDVDRAFAPVPDGWWTGRTVYWIAHSECRWHQPAPSPSARPTLATELARTGMTVRYLCGPTTDLLTDVADRWSLHPGPTTPGPRRLATTNLGLSDSQRRAATFLLYNHLDMPTETTGMLREGNVDTAPKPHRRLPKPLRYQPRWLHLNRSRRRAQLARLHKPYDA